MRFALKKPCPDCPFHKRGKRLRHRHMASILAYRGPFPCHQTVAYRDRYQWKDEGKGQACAGRLAFERQKDDRPHVVALAARLGAKIDAINAPSDLYLSDAEIMEAQRQ